MPPSAAQRTSGMRPVSRGVPVASLTAEYISFLKGGYPIDSTTHHPSPTTGSDPVAPGDRDRAGLAFLSRI
jgi:hypothetical protein